MKWVITALVALQLPFLFIVFVMAGTDGKKESLISVWLAVIPLGLLSLATIVLAFIRSQWGIIEWAVAALACIPTLIVLWNMFR
jgi:hypothetical protein